MMTELVVSSLEAQILWGVPILVYFQVAVWIYWWLKRQWSHQASKPWCNSCWCNPEVVLAQLFACCSILYKYTYNFWLKSIRGWSVLCRCWKQKVKIELTRSCTVKVTPHWSAQKWMVPTLAAFTCVLLEGFWCHSFSSIFWLWEDMGGPEKDWSCLDTIYLSFLTFCMGTLDVSSFFILLYTLPPKWLLPRDVLLHSVPPEAKLSLDMCSRSPFVVFTLYSPFN